MEILKTIVLKTWFLYTHGVLKKRKMVKNSYYYLYIDDSGKFHNKRDKHVVYSFLLFDKKGRKKYFDKLFKAATTNFPSGDIRAKNGIKITKNSLVLEPIKGTIFCNKYPGYVRRQDNRFLNRFNSLLIPYNECLYIGSVAWCKEKEKNFDESERTKESYILKKSIMISAILAFLIENKIIEKNSQLKIYIDRETDIDLPDEFKRKQLISYLNNDIKTSKIKESTKDIEDNKNILNEDVFSSDAYSSCIKKAGLKVVNLEFLDSSSSFFVQGADILAHLTFKKLNYDRGHEVLDFLATNYLFLKVQILPSGEVVNLSNSEFCCSDLKNVSENNINKIIQSDKIEN